MDWKLFFSTFGLIFLAELGDKTQLTAMAQSAGAKSPWTVFVGASCALVASTLVAVLIGSNLERLVDVRYIRMAAGGLFLVFGALLLIESIRAKPAEAAAAPALPAKGLLAEFAMELAAEFEEASGDDYRKLAAGATDPGHRELFLSLAEEEDSHLAALRGAPTTESKTPVETAPVQTREELLHDVADDDRPTLEHAIEHEKATAAFYRSLADNIALPSLKSVFRDLAAKEANHAERLQKLLEA